MYSVPAEQGMERNSFQIFEITKDGLPTYHAYSLGFWGRSDWRFSTAIKEIDSTTELNSVVFYYWATKSGSTYSCSNYVDYKFTNIGYLMDWFKGDSIRALSEEEFKEWFVNFR